MKKIILPGIKDIKNLKGKRVILRLDFNVPIKNGKIVETMRIDRAMPTLEYLLKKKARVIILSHLGKDASMSLKPVARYLNRTIKVGFVPDFRKDNAMKIVNGLQEGSAILFENLRIDEREILNDLGFAKYLASFGDIYVNDAFAVSHRTHASVVGITKYLPAYAGFLMADEIKNLSLALSPKHPFLFILGGSKFNTKIPLMKKFMKISDTIFVGGVLANDFFKDAGLEIGRSMIDKHTVNLAALFKKGKIILPTDVVVKNMATNKILVKKVSEVTKNESIVDVGPQTINTLESILKKVKLVVWNGPLGFYEGGFDRGTVLLLNTIAETKATSIIGGGDTVAVVEKLGLNKKISFVSTGGGATLDYLIDGKLPGIEAILKNKKRE